ncbi:hypothetical protein [Streptomyces tropicalis]|uniref:Uncharacterized protein n=1 Tax=Streptomyces tropicalis TaxID=3034234 RepID=A0ABT6AAM0_9ACTN|nr:hypothetical protein [Streptomyces tropicalis]MDF3301503.1 hypothetical protein [Streptomyces tropicalis]
MSAGWVAGTVRARALAARCAGPEGARELARSRSLDEALRRLDATPYRSRIRTVESLPAAQRAVAATLLWHLRVLAGWLPRGGVGILRPLAAGFEIANVTALLCPPPDPTPPRSVPPGSDEPTASPPPGAEDPREPAPAADAGLPDRPRPYEPGALATAWRTLAAAATPAAVRAALAASAWGDPGSDIPGPLLSAMRLTAALHTATASAAAPEGRRWAAGRAALVTAREYFVHRRDLSDGARRSATALLGVRAVDASTYDGFRHALPATARWVLDDAGTAGDLWRAELHWWHTLDTDGRATVRTARTGPAVVVGAVAVMSADAWAVRGALALAARGGAAPGARDALV